MGMQMLPCLSSCCQDGAELRFCLRSHAGRANRAVKLRFRLRMHALSGQKGAAGSRNCPPRPDAQPFRLHLSIISPVKTGLGVLEQAEPQLRGTKTRFGVRAEAIVQICGRKVPDVTCLVFRTLRNDAFASLNEHLAIQTGGRISTEVAA